MLQPGVILSERYEIIEKIGIGGMSVVYKARCKKLQRNVAIKVLRDEYCADEEFVRKFKVEAQSAASLSHPNIVNIYDVGSDKKIYYIVMELIEGITLKDYIKENGKLSDSDTIRISMCIASALEQAHANHIIHRDIKPQNVLIAKDGRVKVTDFGIARVTTGSTINASKSVSGSVHYISPEQARGVYSDEKSDLYSLGITMYEMCTGEVPFQAESPVSVALLHIQEELPKPSEKNETIGKNLENIILKATQKKSELRYESAVQLLSDLRKCKDFPEDHQIAEMKDIDESPTLFMSNNEMRKIWDEDEDVEVNENKKQVLEKSVIILGVISAVLLVGALSIFLLRDVGEKLVPNEIYVPNVTDMTVEKAKVTLQEIGLILSVSEEKFDDEIKENHIISQDIEEQTAVSENTTIEVVVSKGIEKFKVPDVRDLQFKDAQQYILKANLTYILKTQNHDYIPAGVVIQTIPEAGELLNKGDQVEIIASVGPEEKKVFVPDVYNIPLAQAELEFNELNLEVGSVTYSHNDNVEKDYVIHQTTEAGTEVAEGYLIDLVVSLGKKEISTILIVNDLFEYGKTEGLVKVILVSEDGTETEVYNQTVKLGEFPLRIPVAGRGIGKAIVYLDGVLQYNYEINFDEVEQ